MADQAYAPTKVCVKYLCERALLMPSPTGRPLYVCPKCGDSYGSQPHPDLQDLRFTVAPTPKQRANIMDTHGIRPEDEGPKQREAREEETFIGVGGLAHAAGFNVGTKPETHPSGDPATDTISYLLDLLDMYDERLAEIDGEEKVYTARHKAGKQRARECLDWLRRLRTHSPEEPVGEIDLDRVIDMLSEAALSGTPARRSDAIHDAIAVLRRIRGRE